MQEQHISMLSLHPNQNVCTCVFGKGLSCFKISLQKCTFDCQEASLLTFYNTDLTKK